MPKDVNKHGLSRHIPAGVKRQVRRECGFGCVCCGFAIVHYDHIDPPFEDAMVHHPDGIGLLCGRCHDLVTRGVWSREKTKQARENPRALQRGFSHGAFDVGRHDFSVRIGPYTSWNSHALLVGDEPLVVLEPPEVAGSPFRISARFFDEADRLVMTILRNEWRAWAHNWDITAQGQVITVRKAPNKIALRLRCQPPGSVIIERMRCRHAGASIEVNEQRIKIVFPDGNQGEVSFSGTMKDVSLKIEQSCFCLRPGKVRIVE